MTRAAALAALLLAGCSKPEEPAMNRPTSPVDAGARTAPVPPRLDAESSGPLAADLTQPDGVLGKRCPDGRIEQEVVAPAWTAGVKVGGWGQHWCVMPGMAVDGEFEAVSRDGRPVATGTMRGGKPDGAWRYFHDDGAPAMEGRWRDGAADGTWTFRPRGGEPVIACFAVGKRIECP